MKAETTLPPIVDQGCASGLFGTAKTRTADAPIGGTSMTHGGDGSIVGTMLSTLFMALIYNAFVQSGISTYYQDVFTGAMLIFAVLVSETLRAIKQRSTLQARA